MGHKHGPRFTPKDDRTAEERDRQRQALEREVVSIAQAAVTRAVAADNGLRERLARIGTNEPVSRSRKYQWADQLVRDAGDALRKNAATLEDEEAEAE